MEDIKDFSGEIEQQDAAADNEVTIDTLLEDIQSSQQAEQTESDTATETVEQPEEDAPEAENDADGQPNSTAQPYKNQKDVDKAFAARLAAERRKHENDPVYQLGRIAAERYGGDTEKARQSLMNERAEELAKDPKALALHVLNGKASPAEPEPSDPVAAAETIAQDLAGLINDGVLPNDFNVKEYIDADRDFLTNCEKFGAAKAVIRAQANVMRHRAETTAAQQLERNRALPQSTRPTNNAQPAPINFKDMTEAEFKAFEAKVRKAEMEGKRVKF